MSDCLVEIVGEGTCCGCPGLCVSDQPVQYTAVEPLTYEGQVIVGTCENCRMAIWGPPGSGPKTEHSYCGVVVQPAE